MVPLGGVTSNMLGVVATSLAVARAYPIKSNNGGGNWLDTRIRLPVTLGNAYGMLGFFYAERIAAAYVEQNREGNTNDVGEGRGINDSSSYYRWHTYELNL